MSSPSTQEIIDDLDQITKELHLTVHRFHSTRPFFEHPETDSAQFIFKISLWESGHRINSVLRKRVNTLVLQIVGINQVQTGETGPVRPISDRLTSTVRRDTQSSKQWPILQFGLGNPHNHCYVNHDQLNPIYQQLIRTQKMTFHALNPLVSHHHGAESTTCTTRRSRIPEAHSSPGGCATLQKITGGQSRVSGGIEVTDTSTPITLAIPDTQAPIDARSAS